jgi:hypothetical protein
MEPTRGTGFGIRPIGSAASHACASARGGPAPIWFRPAAMSYLRPGPPVEDGLQDCVADVVTKGPRTGQQPLRAVASRAPSTAQSQPNRNRLVPKSLLKPISQYLADMPHLHSLRRHRVPSSSTSGEETSHLQATLERCLKGAASCRNEGATISRNQGATSFRNRGRIAPEFALCPTFGPAHEPFRAIRLRNDLLRVPCLADTCAQPIPHAVRLR